MRYPLAWAETAQQNSVLKYSLLFSSILSLVLILTTSYLVFKNPLVIERGCYSTPASLGNNKRTNDEIESFLRFALPIRFSTDSMTSAYIWLSPEEDLAKISEFKELVAKKIRQSILINEIKFNDQNVSVEIDRVLSVDKLKSVFPANIQVRVATVSRSDSNPYGLIIEKIELKKEGTNVTETK